jgi:capsular polysaccharide biosynthesis protein
MQIKAYLKIVIKRIWIVILIPLLASGVTAAINLFALQPVYESSMTFYVMNTEDEELESQQLIKDCRELIKSKLIIQAVIDQLNLVDLTEEELAKNITVNILNDSGFFEIKVRDTDNVRVKTIIDKISILFQERFIDLFNIKTLHVIDEAKIPSEPTSPRPLMNTFIVFFLALFLAISAIFVIEYFDDTIKNVEDAEKILGIKVIAIIPSLHLE